MIASVSAPAALSSVAFEAAMTAYLNARVSLDASRGGSVLAPPAAIPSSASGYTPGYIPGAALAGSATSLAVAAAAPGAPLLRQLSALPSGQLESLLASQPQLVTSLLASPPAAREVASWWSSLGSIEQSAMLRASPRLVGNLDGVPSEVRNVANRTWVSDTISSLSASVAVGVGRAVNTDSEREVHMLGQLEGALGSGASVPQRSLLAVDPSGQGTAAVVIGDLATADYVTYMIPGMFFTVDGQITDWTDAASRLYDEQVSWLHLIDQSQPGAAQKTVAVVAWMGYETPNLTDIATLDLAFAGRDALAHVIEGLQTERTGNEPYVTVLAHSYGSTATLMALTEYDFHIDALVLVGAPGSEVQSVSQLHVNNGNVFVAKASWDPIPNSSYFGNDPGAASFGAKTMSVTGGIDEITHQVLAASTGHNEYFAAGTESVRNMALIGIGHGELVTDGTSSDAKKTLAALKQ